MIIGRLLATLSWLLLAEIVASVDYRLKFQNELATLSSSRRELEQQIFKCQLRLVASKSLKQRSSQEIPANVSLSIDWLKDGRALDSGEQPVSVINVQLKSSERIYTDKRNKSRVEIKNTFNGAQMKITSRLKLSRLKSTDSGRYKCLGRASFNNSQNWLEQQTLESSEAKLEVLGEFNFNLVASRSSRLDPLKMLILEC